MEFNIGSLNVSLTFKPKVVFDGGNFIVLTPKISKFLIKEVKKFLEKGVVKDRIELIRILRDIAIDSFGNEYRLGLKDAKELVEKNFYF